MEDEEPVERRSREEGPSRSNAGDPWRCLTGPCVRKAYGDDSHAQYAQRATGDQRSKADVLPITSAAPSAGVPRVAPTLWTTRLYARVATRFSGVVSDPR